MSQLRMSQLHSVGVFLHPCVPVLSSSPVPRGSSHEAGCLAGTENAEQPKLNQRDGSASAPGTLQQP
jgi:hypothetical protein